MTAENKQNKQESPMYLDADGQWKLKQDKRLLTPEEITEVKTRFSCLRCGEAPAESIAKAQLAKADKHRLDRPTLMEEAKEIVLEIRQYLCNTEFAEEPFKLPVDINKLTVEFPKQILALFDEEELHKYHDREQHRLNGEWAELVKQSREMTLREVGEWLDTKWVSYGTFAFIKLSDEEMKSLKQGKFPGGG